VSAAPLLPFPYSDWKSSFLPLLGLNLNDSLVLGLASLDSDENPLCLLCVGCVVCLVREFVRVVVVDVVVVVVGVLLEVSGSKMKSLSPLRSDFLVDDSGKDSVWVKGVMVSRLELVVTSPDSSSSSSG